MAETNVAGKFETYITPPLKPTALDLDKSILLKARSFHLLGTPSEVRGLVMDILRMRSESGIEGRPLFVWEPAAAECHPDNLEVHFDMLLFVDVISPSYEDLYCLTVEPRERIPFRRELVQDQVAQFLNVDGARKRDSKIVVRCGPHGCYYTRGLEDEEDQGWVSSFWDGGPAMVDPTGSGSAFLGAFTVALLETDNLRAACLRGQVAASFAMEQYGPPKKTRRYKLVEHPYRLTRKELWNHDDPLSRLKELEERRENWVVALDPGRRSSGSVAPG
ncbi:hypothetical protein F5X97DRAFT_302245 [Nemania serpens]|nr:hypothetical protein F5X97DRAFT_302245 [Nemania serpens]